MELSLYNTLTRSKELFKPIAAGKAGLYTCGFTVYDYAHIGNLRSYIFADVLKRALIYAGYDVNHVENITDVGHLVGDGDEGEDKMEVGSRKAGKTAWEIAKYYTQVFQKDLLKSDILSPNTWAPATEYIPEQIEFIKVLEQKGYTYTTSDGVYFDTSKQEDYGKLAMLDKGGLREGARVEANKEKRNPTDFALWKFSPANEKRQMEWESPWGRGFPGWHIECSAISTKFLGEHFDIHTGGIDHVPVHHTNEIAQNEARFGHRVVNYWLHNDFILVNGTKMSKSLGNLYTLDDIEKRGFSPLALRYLYLGAHYKQQLNFTWDSLEAAENAYTKLVRHLAELALREAIPTSEEENKKIILASAAHVDMFERAISDNLNTPMALAALHNMLKDGTLSPAEQVALAYKFDQILGLDLEKAVAKLNEVEVPEEIERLVEKREQARKNQDWQKADELRKEIEEKGWHVEDAQTGPKITRV